MHWLRENAFLATWLALPVGIVVAIFQTRQSGVAQLKWFRALMYFAFPTCLAVAFTPTLDSTTRQYASNLLYMLLIIIVVSRND